MDCLRKLLEESKFCDITFTFRPNNEKESAAATSVGAHKMILAIASPVFEAMFYGQLRETKETIEIEDFTAAAFKNMMRYIYTDTFDKEMLPLLLETLSIARKYQVTKLSTKCLELVLDRIKKPTENILEILAFSVAHSEPQIEEVCLRHLAVLHPTTLLEVCSEMLDYRTWKRILDVNYEHLEPIDTFRALSTWSHHECRDKGLEPTVENRRNELGDLLQRIDYNRMSVDQFVKIVDKTELLTDSEIAEIMRILAKKEPTVFKLPKSRYKIKTFHFAEGIPPNTTRFNFKPTEDCYMKIGFTDPVLKGIITVTLKLGFSILRRVEIPEKPVHQTRVGLENRKASVELSFLEKEKAYTVALDSGFCRFASTTQFQTEIGDLQFFSAARTTLTPYFEKIIIITYD